MFLLVETHELFCYKEIHDLPLFCSHTLLYVMSREAMYHSLNIPSCFDPPVKRLYLEVMTIRTSHFPFLVMAEFVFWFKESGVKLSKQKLIYGKHKLYSFLTLVVQEKKLSACMIIFHLYSYEVDIGNNIQAVCHYVFK